MGARRHFCARGLVMTVASVILRRNKQGELPVSIHTGIAALVVAVTTATTALAFDIAKMTETERTEFRSEIREYLLENPEVLMEAIAVLEGREATAQAESDASMIAANAAAIFADDMSWVGGNPDGDVTMVEFLDYRCGYCRRAHPEVSELISSDGNIRLIVKEFPILGEQSVLASRFAISTKLNVGDDAYKQVHDALITLRGDVTAQSLQRVARDLDLDASQILGGMGDPRVDEIINANRELAQALGITGTPTFVLETEMLRGYLPLDGMRQIVNEARGEG